MWYHFYNGFTPLRIHYDTLNTSNPAITFPGTLGEWIDQGEITIAETTLQYRMGSPKIISGGSNSWWLYYYAQGLDDADQLNDRYSVNQVLVANSTTLDGEWIPQNLDAKYYQANLFAANDFITYVTSSDYKDFEAITEVIIRRIGSQRKAGIAFRYDHTEDDGYVAYLDFNDFESVIRLQRVDDGIYTQLDSYVIPYYPLPKYVPGFQWRLRVRAYGSDITVSYSPWGDEWVDGITETDGTYMEGEVGLTTSDATAYFDDYRIREYVIDSQGREPIIGEGVEVGLTPEVETLATTLVEETTATLQGNITIASSNDIDSRGFVWDTTNRSTPSSVTSPSASDYANNWTENGSWSKGDTFNHGITSLTQGELYYTRAAGHSNVESYWAYGDELTFLTKPVEPNTFVAVDGTGESIDLTWNNGTGRDTTEIWGKSGSLPATRGDGTLTYNSTGTSTTDNTPSHGETWYYKAWSFATEGGLWQYSDAYDETKGVLCDVTPPTVITNNATLVEETTATFNGNITVAEMNATVRGFDWDIDSGTPYTWSWTEPGSFGIGTFSYGVVPSTLTEGELYYFRAKATNAGGQGNGSELTFLTKPVEPNSLSASNGVGESIDLTWNKGTGAGNTEIWGQSGSYPSKGVGTLTYNSTGTTHTDNNPSSGETWYYRAWSFVTEGGLHQYSDAYSEDNASCIGNASVTTNNASSVEETTVTMNANLTSTGGENNDEQGFEWDINTGSPYSYNQTSGGSFSTGVFNESVTSLDEGELYFFRGMSHNTEGWAYGSELTFLTKPNEPTAFLNTSRTSTSITSAWTSGNGSDFYIVRYDTSGYPADYSSGTLTCNTSSTTCTATPLSSGQIYYFRVWSWCTEEELAQWSDTYDELTDYTNPADVTSFDAYNPSASTIDLSWIKGTGGDKTHIRGQQGSYPANVSTGTQIYFDTGTSITHSGLGSDETWYYRAWAYNNTSGYYSDSYDQDFEVTTMVGAPSVTTIAASLIEETTASITGNITVINDTNIIERGFQYDLDSAPPYTWNWTQNGTFGLGTFTYNLTSLSYGELYYFRALAENDIPTYGYGSELQFLTKPEAPTGLASSNATTTSISLSWTTGNGSDKTMIRYATSDYPATYNDGTQGYFGSSNVTTISSLDPGITYYLRAWSYATEDSLEQYSDSYSEVTVSTSGVTSGIDSVVRGNLKMLGLVLLPIGLMAIGFWKEKQWVMMMAGISFIGLGAYGLVDADGTWGSSMIIGAASLIFAMATLSYAMLSMREKPEINEDLPEDEAYAAELAKDRTKRQQARKERRDE